MTAAKKPEPASLEEMRMVFAPLILDVRDPDEVAAGKGGPPASLPGSRNIPLNMDGVPQSERLTTKEEFEGKLIEAAVLPEDKAVAIITHCGSGGRGGKAAAILQDLGYTRVLNGGGPSRIAEALYIPEKKPTPAPAEELKAVAERYFVIDARDPADIEAGKGGPPAVIPGSVNVPLNMDGVAQGDRPTTPAEYMAKLKASGVLPEGKDVAIITHCNTGGRGGKAQAILQELGYTNVLNGGSTGHIAESLGLPRD